MNIALLPWRDSTCWCSFPRWLQVAVPDVLKASADADILIFVVPHQFIGKLCDQLKGRIKKEAIGISLIKVWRGLLGGDLMWLTGLVTVLDVHQDRVCLGVHSGHFKCLKHKGEGCRVKKTNISCVLTIRYHEFSQLLVFLVKFWIWFWFLNACLYSLHGASNLH